MGSFKHHLFISRCYTVKYLNIHRMQIWWTTRSAPGTSRMKARLVRLDNASPEKVLIWSLCFALSTRFCVPECHSKGVKSFTAEKVFFSSVISFVFNGKLKETEARSLRSPKELFKFRLEDLRN